MAVIVCVLYVWATYLENGEPGWLSGLLLGFAVIFSLDYVRRFLAADNKCGCFLLLLVLFFLAFNNLSRFLFCVFFHLLITCTGSCTVSISLTSSTWSASSLSSAAPITIRTIT